MASSPGLTSGLIDGSNAWQRAVGIIPNTSLPYTTFGGQSVEANDVLVRYTINGDANLDGAVGFADLVAVNQHYGQSGKIWRDGDFNFDGSVGFPDLVAVNQNYNTSLSSGGNQMMATGGNASRSEVELAVAADLRKKIARFDPDHLAEFDEWYTAWIGGGLLE